LHTSSQRRHNNKIEARNLNSLIDRRIAVTDKNAASGERDVPHEVHHQGNTEKNASTETNNDEIGRKSEEIVQIVQKIQAERALASTPRHQQPTTTSTWEPEQLTTTISPAESLEQQSQPPHALLRFASFFWIFLAICSLFLGLFLHRRSKRRKYWQVNDTK
jgi:lipopolysaccharide export LptBFGC system permease protein LptF